MSDESSHEASGTPAGWYPDTSGAHSKRYWDGQTWTDQYVDEPGAAPTATMTATAQPSPPTPGRDRTLLIAVLAGVAALVVGALAAIVIKDDSSKTDKERAARRELEAQRDGLKSEAARVAALSNTSKDSWPMGAFIASFLSAKEGDCVNDVADDFTASRVVSCSQPHNAEVFAVIDGLPASSDAGHECEARDTGNSAVRVSFSFFSAPQTRRAVCMRE